MPVQGLQHEAVTAQRDDHVRVFGRVRAVARGQRRERGLRFIGGTGEKCEFRQGHDASIPARSCTTNLNAIRHADAAASAWFVLP